MNLQESQNLRDPMLASGPVAREFGVHVRTLDAWTARLDLGFPQPMVVNGRRYWKRSEIDAWKASRSITTGRKVA